MNPRDIPENILLREYESRYKMRKEQKFVSVVAYVYNDEKLIRAFLEYTMEKCRESFEKCELILVDDNSSDRSVDQIHSYFEENPADYMVSIVKLGLRQGIESAMNIGRDMAIGDYVYEFDDLHTDYPADMIMKAYENCLEGNDIVAVTGTYKVRLTSRVFYSLYNRFSHSQYPIGPETFRLLSRRAINRIKSVGRYVPYRKAVYMNCGLKACHLTYDVTQEQRRNYRKGRRDERMNLAMDSFIYFTDIMERVSLGTCVFFSLLAMGVIVYTIWSYFMDQHLASGWVSLMGFLSLGFIGIFGIMTIVLRYLGVLINLTYKQQHHMIEDIEKISGN